MKKFLFLILVLFINVSSQNYKSNIDKYLNKLPTNTKVSIIAYSPESGDTLYSLNPELPLIPASNIKLLTTATALYLMDFTYSLDTKFLIDGEIDNNRLNGNIIIKGLGNPFMKDTDLDKIIGKLKELGIDQINGDIIGDDSYFDDYYNRKSWIRGERTNVNVPPVSALVINKNKITVSFDFKKKKLKKPLIKIFPKSDFLKIENRLKTTNGRTRVRIGLIDDGNNFTLKISGKIKPSFYQRRYAVYINNPPLYVASLLKDKLIQSSIKVSGKAKVGIAKSYFDVIENISTPLDSLISVVNKNSDNFLAECLFKSIGAYYSNSQGNSLYAAQAINEFLFDNEIYNKNINIVDGSGISRHNKLTTKTLIGVLDFVFRNKHLFNAYYNSLSVAGVDGTLSDRMISSSSKFFRGKTGTLNGVSSISGFLINRKGELICISILMQYKKYGANYYREIQDKIISLFY